MVKACKFMLLRQLLQLSKSFGWISKVPESEQNEAELMHDEWLGVVHEAEQERYSEVVKTKKAIKAWGEEPGMIAFAKAARLRYLRWKLKESLDLFARMREEHIAFLREYGEGSEQANAVLRQAEGVSKRISGYEISIAVLEGKVDPKNLITDEMIERAKEYPIRNLLEVGQNGRARCIFHDGEGYNLDIRKNFAHCYVCGDSGDTIRVYRVKHGATFREAVMFLQ